MTEEIELNRLRLRQDLNLLAKERGLRRPDLLGVLDGKLAELRAYWNLDTRNGSEAMRNVLTQNLNELIGRLEPRPSNEELSIEQRTKRYRYCIRASFNILSAPELEAVGLEERRKWLDSPEQPRALRTNIARSRRDLSDAIEQMVEMMLADHKVPSVEESAADAPAPAADAVTESGLSSVAPSGRRRQIKRVVFVALGLCVCLVGGGLIAAHNDLPPFDEPENQSLSITNYGFSVMNGGLGLAYPPDRAAHMDEAATGLVQANLLEYEDVSGFALREVEAGAYALDGMQLEMGLEGLDDREVTVYDIRPVLTHVEVPLGAAFVLRSAGGGEYPTIATFNMDSDRPIARARGIENDSGESLFNVQRISLPKGGKETLSLWFSAKSKASEFYVDVLYEVAGKKYKKRLSLNGQPFRIAPIACAEGSNDPELADRYDNGLAAKRYQKVLHLSNDGMTKPSTEVRDPDKFATSNECSLFQ